MSQALPSLLLSMGVGVPIEFCVYTQKPMTHIPTTAPGKGILGCLLAHQHGKYIHVLV